MRPCDFLPAQGLAVAEEEEHIQFDFIEVIAHDRSFTSV